MALLIAACSSNGATSTDSESVDKNSAIPEMVASPELLAQIGASFTSGDLPAVLGGRLADPLAGSVLLNPEIDPPDAELRALHWFVTQDQANLVVSALQSRTDDGSPTWRPTSAWTITLDADMVLTVGANVCQPAPHTYDWQNGEFIAVVNAEQDHAANAWTMTENGPTPYADLASLECERFIP